MRLIPVVTFSLLTLAACGPQAPDATKWQAFASAAAGHGTTVALARRCDFATADLDTAFSQAQERYALTAEQQAELSQISATAAAAVDGATLPAEHMLCADGQAMSLRVQELLQRL